MPNHRNKYDENINHEESCIKSSFIQVDFFSVVWFYKLPVPTTSKGVSFINLNLSTL